MESAQERGHAVFEQQVHEGGAAEEPPHAPEAGSGGAIVQFACCISAAFQPCLAATTPLYGGTIPLVSSQGQYFGRLWNLEKAGTNWQKQVKRAKL